MNPTEKILYSRNHPYDAPVLKVKQLNSPDSDKETNHIEIDLSGSGLTYKPGDALGVYPVHHEEYVKELLEIVNATGDESVILDSDDETDLRHALSSMCSLNNITVKFLKLILSKVTDLEKSKELESYIKNRSELTDWDILDIFHKYPVENLKPQELVSTLANLSPRLYSIASSIKKHPGEVHLTVVKVVYEIHNRVRKGVASSMLGERVTPGDRIPVFIKESKFALPDNPATPIIMVGPGTGIAPFRAFLEEREMTKATGKNWLFFGDRKIKTDFLYQDEIEAYKKSGLLTNLDLAFSRDQEHKIYVQNRMKEKAAEIYQWLEDGACFYVCGDAKNMGKAVDLTLREIIQKQGGKTEEETKEYVSQMKKERRYQRDVY